MTHAYIIHENEAWLPPLRAALDAAGVPFVDWHLDSGSFDFSAPPPAGVFYNRMSASSHTRGHVHAPEYTASVLAWLGAHGRRVFNDGRALELELSKIKQYAALSAFGVRVPRTAVAVGRDALRAAARNFGAPLIVKPNRGGKGAGVRLIQTLDALDQYIDDADYDPGPDGTMLLQDYIRSPDHSIIRCEFVGGKFLYAVHVDTSNGFELCPADVCAVETSPAPFEILDDFYHPNLERYEKFMAANGIHIAGIEMILDARGRAWTYDVNTNTNYNPEAEAAAEFTGTPRSGMGAIARFLGLERRRQAALPAAA